MLAYLLEQVQAHAVGAKPYTGGQGDVLVLARACKQKDTRTRARTHAGTHPGSMGHSPIAAISMSDLPFNSQCEHRSMIGMRPADGAHSVTCTPCVMTHKVTCRHARPVVCAGLADVESLLTPSNSIPF